VPTELPDALLRSLDLLRCPHCGGALRAEERRLRCEAGHSFDVARQGYVALLTGRPATSGDDDAAVRARERFLATGVYTPLREAVADLATADAPADAAVLDVGCGTGYHLAGVLDRLPGARGLGLDSSTRALRATVRAHPRAAAASWDVFRPLPVADGSVDVVLDVFAPRHPEEFRRVLRPDGRLVVARPTDRHLAELRAQLPGTVSVDPAKEDRLRESLEPLLEPVDTRRVEHGIALDRASARDWVTMTPSGRHVDPAALDDVPLPGRVTVSVLATAYRPR